jgi:hypothetical protein
MKRRDFLASAGAVAASSVFPGFSIGKPGPSPNSKVNVAFIGSGGWIAQQPYNQGCKDENLVAFCDVDRNVCAENMKNWRTNQPFYDDFRVMLDKMHNRSMRSLFPRPTTPTSQPRWPRWSGASMSTHRNP